MAANRFEKNIKDKLEKRTISPSDDAWHKLSGRLENHEKKRNNKSFWWLGIAASVIGVLLVVTQVFKNESVEQNTPQIVVTPEVIKQDKTDKIASENIEDVSEDIKIEEGNQPNQIQKKSTVIHTNSIKETTLVAEEKDIQNTKETHVEPVKIIPEKLTLEEQKIQEVIAQANTLKNDENQVTENEIEALLIEAQNDIKLKRLYNESTKKVDALALLQDVENELDESFRDKVFKALKENFITVKTAVAQRND
ncbi:hypothetical protein [Hwangdonia lutea]|uniref:Uncharacterized protein n=1 Tax=Hwangdonia lutea TaxID=3075823 RepID=A0AA97HQU7_9FLAO|nr:hypothetical protein [Hwangdonia sp. SCSIO 19198]WOD44326.1 hypothetical protein RNZ46_03470 [Hwangdonia sp. SCSIO 19198]